MSEGIYEEQRKLVLTRFKTLNPDMKVLLGGDKELSVKQIIQHVENNDDFGKKVVKIEIKMLRILGTG